MSVYERLVYETTAARSRFMNISILRRALHGEVSREDYVAFLSQAYQHVKHTVPLLANCGARLPARLGWLREAMSAYEEEETGHEHWILEDIRAAGGDAEAARMAKPLPAAELMVAYAYDLVNRRNPVGFLGMVFVLESTSVQLASCAAAVIGTSLQLPEQAFRYLTSHGSLDQDHIAFYRQLVDRLDRTEDQNILFHSANMFYRLYGDVFDSIPEATDSRSRIGICKH